MEIIQDNKVAVTINGQTIYVSAIEAEKIKKQLQKSANNIAVEQPTPCWQGKSLILG